LQEIRTVASPDPERFKEQAAVCPDRHQADT
jgi:hypothetical protein